MTPINGLTIAVPRGALFADTVDLLAALGLDTDELRSNDRKLLFEDIGVITMRPSDVPTYVEAGAADLGVTGKDVLLEQAAQRSGEGGREVYELLDLGYGRCTMVLASKAGPDPAREALRRLGVMRVATKYPRIAARHLEETGRQAEIVEVKGSVELAPLTGMVEAIVDLTATGTTLRENNLVVREEIVVCTARLIANPVAHKLKAAAIDELLERLRALPSAVRRRAPRTAPEMRLRAPRRRRTLAARSAARPAPPRSLRSLVPDGDSVAEAVREIVAARARARATRRCSTTRAASTPPATSRGRCSSPGEELDEAIKRLPLELVAGLQVAIANVALVAEAGVGARRRRSTLPQGQRIVLREVPVGSAAVYVPGGRAPYPSTVVMGVVTARAAGVIDVAVCAPPGRRRADRPRDPRHLPAVRRRARLPHGRRAGDRRARLRHRDGRAAST